ncbi:MAG: hypothetical protein JWM50_1832 [Microbacteriaceae bacterium]|jgi:hypothetical protein|nr:hypothetical protein [Microbacteriaceae bacterium]
MIVITADQVDSRSTADLVGPVLDLLGREFGASLLLPPDRTAGDEIQLLTRSGETALAIALVLTRTRRWSVGIGVGSTREPLGAGIRASTGDAFIAARSAVERAKKRSTRFAVNAEPVVDLASDVEALVDLLLVIRGRRSEQGWEVHDLVTSGLTQADAAARLGITPQSASKRARAAELRVEDAAVAALARLVDLLDSTVSPRPGDTQ